MDKNARRTMYPLPIPQSPYLDGPILLKNGSPAYLRRVKPDDGERVRDLLKRCSVTARLFRFFHGVDFDSPEVVARLIDPGTRSEGLSLIVEAGSDERPVAVASYSSEPDADTAEVAFLVEDAYQGRGIGTLLLERLAMAAEDAGIAVLEAFVMEQNHQMLSVFTDSGFEIERRPDDDGWYIRLDLTPTRAGVEKMEERDRMATQASIFPFFHPRSVAVIGASRKPESIGNRVLQNIIRSSYEGPVFPVNPNAQFVASIPAYPSVKDIPYDVDLAVVSVPQPYVLDVIDDCAEKGVRALVVLTAGFAETGPEGQALQKRLVRKVRGAGMRMIGPNCLGLLNTNESVQLNATFAPVPPFQGHVAMSSQSGALGLAILEYARSLGVGLSSFVSVGNKADVSGNDLLQWWEGDPQTEVILLYLESFGNPRRFARLARRVARKKPIIAVKGGTTSAGRRAAGSHTAALAADDVAVDALFKQAGVIRTQTLEEMFDVASLLAHQPLPKGKRVAILTNAGGPGILCADACEANGLTLPALSEETQAKLMSFLPSAASASNPVDMVASASAEQYQRSLEILVEDESVDAVIVIFIPTGSVDIEAVATAVREGGAKAAEYSKPIIASFMSMRGTESPLSAGGRVIPSYRFPESAAIAVARAALYAEWRNSDLGEIPDHEDLRIRDARAICRKALAERGDGWLMPDEVSSLLEAFGLPQPASKLATTPDEAVATADEIGYPVVVKLASATLVHKTEWKGVHLNVKDAGGVRRAYETMRSTLAEHGRESEMAGVLVQPMIGKGAEVFVGVTEDPMFGPLVAFGLGGTSVELLGDVVFRITPLTNRDAHEMIHSIKGFRLLEGFRDQPPADVLAAQDILLRISRMVEELQDIAELDLNPVRLFEPGQGGVILDARIMVRNKQA